MYQNFNKNSIGITDFFLLPQPLTWCHVALAQLGPRVTKLLNVS